MTCSHDHDCECGCGGEVYPPYFAIGTVGFILVALTMVLSGIACILASLHGGDIGWDPSFRTACAYVHAITAVCLLVLAAYGLFTGIYAESVLFTVIAVLMLTASLTAKDASLSADAGRAIDLLFGALVLIPTVAFMLNREALLSLAAFAFSFGLIVSEIVASSDAAAGSLIMGIAGTIGGILFAYIAVANLLCAEGGYELPLVRSRRAATLYLPVPPSPSDGALRHSNSRFRPRRFLRRILPEGQRIVGRIGREARQRRIPEIS